METVFVVCAVAGGTLVTLQVLLSLLGLGHFHDLGGDHADSALDHGDDGAGDHSTGMGSGWFVGILTLKSVTAAVTFFGLTGMASLSQGLELPYPPLIATGSGLAAMGIVAAIVRSLYKLKADGSLKQEKAVGRHGRVYLPIPAGNAGSGKVHINVQNRTVEYLAVTALGGLPVGAPVVVVALVDSNTVEVAPLEKGTPQ